ncbi:hypothetical protein GW17_00009490 [Ensete ventricosum]|nr:hypothetical protein GW17_00009490 [Ensete ventricosum]
MISLAVARVRFRGRQKQATQTTSFVHVTGPAAHELINISPAHPLRRPQHANPTRDRKERPDHESGVVFPHPFRYPLLMAVGPSPRPLPQEISFRLFVPFP